MAAPPYAYGGSSYRNAMLNQMQQDDPYASDENYRYPQNPYQARMPAVGAGQIGDLVGGLAPTVAGQVAPHLASSGFGALAGAAGTGGFGATATGPVLSNAQATGLGIATELAGSALKPKEQQATASPFADLTDQYRRREEGSGEGIAGGAVKWGGRGAQVGRYFGPVGLAVGAGVGALGGAIGNAFVKNAASAYSDFSRQDAERAITEMVKTRGGRDLLPGELQQMLIGAGTKPGDRWVGEQGLYSILQSLDKNFAAERAAGRPAAPPAAPPAGGAGTATTPSPAAGAVPRSAPANEVPAAYGGSGGDYGAAANTTMSSAPSETPPAGAPPATTPPAAGETPPAGGTPAVDQSKWDTDSYAKPAYTAPKASATAPAGFEQSKWANPNHQTPKYVVGRILSQYPPKTENVPAAVAEIQKAYPGARQVGNGKVNIPGVGTMDILVGANVGGKRWHAGTTKSRGGAAAGGGAARGLTGAATSGSVLDYERGGISDRGTIGDIIRRIQGISGHGARPGVVSQRDALLKQF